MNTPIWALDDAGVEARYIDCLTETARRAVRPQEEATFPEPIEVRAMQPSSPADEPPRVQYPISSL
jgi:hypothetical protein